MDATYRIQANSSVDLAVTSLSASLPNPTTAGSTLLLTFCQTGTGTVATSNLYTASPPWYQDAVSGAVVFSFRRPNQPGGETSWSFATSGSLAANIGWRVEEWASWSTVAQPDATTNVAGSPAFPANSGLQNNNSTAGGGSAPVPDIPDFGGLAVFRCGPGTAIFPLHSYSSGWSEVDALTNGDGTHSVDFKLLFAESYPGVSGSIDCTMTWDTSNGGTYTDKVVNAYVACYRPAVPFSSGAVLTA